MLDRRWTWSPLVLALAAGLLACHDGNPVTAPGGEDGLTADYAKGGNGAATTSATFDLPFPVFPPPLGPGAGDGFSPPISAPCLGLGEGEGPFLGGRWAGWTRFALTRDGRAHVTMFAGYEQMSITGGGLTWTAAPGAHEMLVFNLPAAPDVPGAFNVRHEIHARFLGPDGFPDLRVTHRVKEVLGPDGVFRHAEFVGFAAECIGGER